MINSDIENSLLVETDRDKLEKIIDLFNLDIRKKDILRASKLSDLQDKISEQISLRIDEKSDEFSNKDLLEYFKTIQGVLNQSNNSLDDVKVPTISINQQNNLSINNNLSKDSRDRVINAVQAILKKAEVLSSESIDVEEK